MKHSLLLLCLLSHFFLQAQDTDSTNLLSLMDSLGQTAGAKKYTRATFKSTMLINAHSVESLGKNVLDIKIAHRFGTLNTGIYELFGLDNATFRLGIDYGITDRFMIGIGRSTYEKQYDGFVKYKILRQQDGKGAMPLTMSFLAGMYINTLRPSDPNQEIYFRSRIDYVFQLLLARKFGEGFSLQFSPSLVHKNLVPETSDKNDIIAFGIGGRQKITKRVTINGEYYYQIPSMKTSGTVNALSFGVDIETGGHVFQFMFTNSTGIAENQYISGTTGEWNEGDIHFGFNIRRVFDFNKKKKTNTSTTTGQN